MACSLNVRMSDGGRRSADDWWGSKGNLRLGRCRYSYTLGGVSMAKQLLFNDELAR